MAVRRFLLAAALTACGSAHAQAVDIPRTVEGGPDFQGVWESRWRTPLERPVEADGPIVAADKADALVAAMYKRLRAEGNQSPDEDFDFGPLMPAPGGGVRTSQIVEPADGKRPLNQAAQDLAKVIRERPERAEDPEPARPAALPDQPQRKLTERFQLNSPDELGYSYTIEDPVMFTVPMRVEFTLLRTTARMFESACHEGNYGLANILSGTREMERRAKQAVAP